MLMIRCGCSTFTGDPLVIVIVMFTWTSDSKTWFRFAIGRFLLWSLRRKRNLFFRRHPLIAVETGELGGFGRCVYLKRPVEYDSRSEKSNNWVLQLSLV